MLTNSFLGAAAAPPIAPTAPTELAVPIAALATFGGLASVLGLDTPPASVMRPAAPAGWSKITTPCSPGGPGLPWIPSRKQGKASEILPCPFACRVRSGASCIVVFNVSQLRTQPRFPTHPTHPPPMAPASRYPPTRACRRGPVHRPLS
eukprot:364060-Chlamydomonas_euryale.AAC.2